jgi:hypothetical protein
LARVHEPHPSAPPTPRHAALAFAVGVALAATALAIAEWDRPPTWREVAQSRAASSAHQSPGQPSRSAAPGSAAAPLPAFATLELARADFPASGPLRLSLGLAEPSADAEPRPVSVLSIQDQRVYSTQARLDAARMVATIEVPTDFLQPGTYLVQMKTTERVTFPLRRYVIEVR